MKSNSQYVAEAEKSMEEGASWTKTTLFRWKPDWDKASSCYEKVVIFFAKSSAHLARARKGRRDAQSQNRRTRTRTLRSLLACHARAPCAQVVVDERLRVRMLGRDRRLVFLATRLVRWNGILHLRGNRLVVEHEEDGGWYDVSKDSIESADRTKLQNHLEHHRHDLKEAH